MITCLQITITQSYTLLKFPISSQKVISWRSERLKLISPAHRALGRNEWVKFFVLNQTSLICQPGWMWVRLFIDLNTASIVFHLNSMSKPVVQAYLLDISSQGIIKLFTSETLISKSKTHSWKYCSVLFVLHTYYSVKDKHCVWSHKIDFEYF